MVGNITLLTDESIDRRGTTLVVTIPATSVADAVAEPVVFTVLNIQIVDDRQDMLRALVEVGNHLGHSSNAFSSGN